MALFTPLHSRSGCELAAIAIDADAAALHDTVEDRHRRRARVASMAIDRGGARTKKRMQGARTAQAAEMKKGRDSRGPLGIEALAAWLPPA